MVDRWFQVEEEPGLPRGVCRLCSEETVAASQFKQLCADSCTQWNQAVHTIAQINDPDEYDKVFYMFYNLNGITTMVHDQVSRIGDPKEAYKRLTDSVESSHKTGTAKVRKRKKQSRYKANSCNCPDCGRHFTTAHDLNTHLNKSSKRVCNICGTIAMKETIGDHLLQRHNKIVHECSFCYKLFDEELALVHHCAEVHGPGSHSCNHCGESFTSDRALRAHMYVHTLFHCNSCPNSFENRKCYKYHKKLCKEAASPKDTLYSCDHCGNTYHNKPSLRIHIVQKHLNVLPFVCSVCGKRTSTLAHLRSHQAVHETERMTLQCTECGAKMRTELGFALHQRIHTGEKPYECEECGEKFLSASRRLDHIKRRHRSAKDMPHGCSKCSARFVRPFELRKHFKNVHENQFGVNMPAKKRFRKQFVSEEILCPQGACVTCVTSTLQAYELCLLVRSSQKLWADALIALNKLPVEVSPPVRTIYAFLKDDSLHILKNYTESDPKTALHRLKNRLSTKKTRVTRKARVARNGPACSCHDCGKVFSSPHYLNNHLQNSAQKQACLICGAVVIRGNDMKEHIQTVHGETYHLCTECPALFPTLAEASKHKKNSHKAGVHTCYDCGRTFPRASSFDAHQQMHAVRTCRTCGTQFANRGCYRVHRSVCEPDAKPETSSLRRDLRSNIRDPATFTCDYCNKTYHSRPQLKNHIMWIHMNVRPHQCQWCGKRFYTSARLAEHSIVHTRERNFACDICGARLVTKMAMVYHKRRHTGEKPYECPDCGDKFISASRRSEHAKRRHGKGPMFHCTLCPCHFVRGHELKKHVARAHTNASEADKKELSKIKSSLTSTHVKAEVKEVIATVHSIRKIKTEQIVLKNELV